MKKLLLPLLVALSAGACSTQTVTVGSQNGRLASSDMQTFFISGLGQTQSINAAAVCGSADRVAKVERVDSVLNGFLAGVTLGIYTPYNAKVYCI